MKCVFDQGLSTLSPVSPFFIKIFLECKQTVFYKYNISSLAKQAFPNAIPPKGLTKQVFPKDNITQRLSKRSLFKCHTQPKFTSNKQNSPFQAIYAQPTVYTSIDSTATASMKCVFDQGLSTLSTTSKNLFLKEVLFILHRIYQCFFYFFRLFFPCKNFSYFQSKCHSCSRRSGCNYVAILAYHFRTTYSAL